MSVTAENSLLNLRTAAKNARTRLGLPESNQAWTYEQRSAYEMELAAEILKYPNSFTPEHLAIAQRAKANASLEDASFDLGDLAAETVVNAVPVLGDFTNKLILGALVLGVVWIVVNRRPSANA